MNKLSVINYIGFMRFWTGIAVLLLVVGCDSVDANDCLQSAGSVVQQQVVVPSFDRILVERGVNMVLIQDSVPRVVVQSGENLLADIQVQVIEGQLELINENDCNFFRDYNLTTIYVYCPDIDQIRSSKIGRAHV